MKNSKPTIAILCGVAVAGACLFQFWRMDQPVRHSIPPARVARKIANPASLSRKKLDALAVTKPAEAEKGYRAFVEGNRRSKDRTVQEEVATARYRLGFLAARRKDFNAARQSFQEASLHYAGTNKIAPDFGGIKDGSEYQAAVCLVAEGKTEEAKSAFIDFIKKEPLSPLAKAAYRRLVRLNGGKSEPAYEALLQTALSAQQKKAKESIVSCGPKAACFVLAALKKRVPSVEEMTRLCKTDSKGTTLENLQHALRECGVKNYGVQLNRKGFARIAAPAILLAGDHYLVLKEVHADYAVVYDPIQDDPASERNIPLPSLSDTGFGATLLVFSPPSFTQD